MHEISLSANQLDPGGLPRLHEVIPDDRRVAVATAHIDVTREMPPVPSGQRFEPLSDTSSARAVGSKGIWALRLPVNGSTRRFLLLPDPPKRPDADRALAIVGAAAATPILAVADIVVTPVAYLNWNRMEQASVDEAARPASPTASEATGPP
jgi:hypothetical protein